MPWKDLSKTQQEFVSRYFTKSKKLFKAAHERGANKQTIADYEEYLSACNLVAGALLSVQGTPVHSDLKSEFEKLKERYERKGDFGLGAQLLTRLQGKILKEKDNARRAKDKKPEKTKLYEEFESKVFRARTKDDEVVKSLSKVLGEKGQEGVDPSKLPLVKEYSDLYKNTLTALKDEWQGPSELDAARVAMTKIVTAFVEDRKDVMKRIDDMIKSPGEIDTATEVLGKNKEYETLLRECNALALELREWGHPKAASHAKDLDGVEKDTESSGLFDVGISVLTLWQREAEKDRTSYLKDYEKALETHKTELAKVVSLKGGIGKKVPKEQVEELDDLIAMAQLTIEEGEDPSKGKNLTALRPLQSILVSASNLARELRNAELLNGITTDKIKATVKILGPADGSKPPEGATVLPNKHAALHAQFADLHTDWMKLPPQKAQTTFTQFLIEAEKFRDEVAAMKLWRDKMNKAAKQGDKLIKDLSKIVFDFGKEDKGWVSQKLRDIFGRTGIKFEGKAASDLEAIKADIASEDATTHDYTEKKLMELTGRLANWLGSAEKLRKAQKSGTSPDPRDMSEVAALLDDQQKAVDERKRQERLVELFKEKNTLMDKAIDAFASEKGLEDETKQELKDIKDLNTAARSQASNNLDAAQEMHQRVSFRLEKARVAPKKASSNFEWLGNMPGYWGAAVTTLQTDIENLGKVVRKAADEDPRNIDLEGLEDDLRLFGSVSRNFKSEAFDKAAKVLGDSSSDLKMEDRKRAREEALSQVRLYRGYLQTNPLIRHAVRNPFGVNAIGMAAHHSLNKIELEVLRGI